MRENTYSGWEGKGNRSSAYATWRVSLELVSDWADSTELADVFEEKPEAHQLAEYIEEMVSDVVFMDDPDQERLVSQYAAAFLDDVSYEEIAEHILLDWDEC